MLRFSAPMRRSHIRRLCARRKCRLIVIYLVWAWPYHYLCTPLSVYSRRQRGGYTQQCTRGIINTHEHATSAVFVHICVSIWHRSGLVCAQGVCSVYIRTLQSSSTRPLYPVHMNLDAQQGKKANSQEPTSKSSHPQRVRIGGSARPLQRVVFCRARRCIRQRRTR